MKNFLIFAGLIFLLKAAVAGPALFDSVFVASISSAYAAGYMAGQVAGAVACVAAGAGLIMHSSTGTRSTVPTA